MSRDLTSQESNNWYLKTTNLIYIHKLLHTYDFDSFFFNFFKSNFFSLLSDLSYFNMY